MHYFFYGTLLDAAVRRLVLGRPWPGVSARLDGFRRVAVPGRSYPTIVADTGSVDGLLVAGMTPLQQARLAVFEGPDYREAALAVQDSGGETVTARVFVPRRPPRSAADWSYERWQRRDRPRFVRALAGSRALVPARTL